MENLKNVAPIEDFNWDAYENGESVASASHEELEKAYDNTLNKVNDREVVDGTATSLTEGPSPALHIAPVLFHKSVGELLGRNAIAHGRAGQVHIYVAELLHKMGTGFGTIQDRPVALLLDDLRRLPGLGQEPQQMAAPLRWG